jgi:acyl-CoA synthetase (AMP-forming)/AMP-acid ligase II
MPEDFDPAAHTLASLLDAQVEAGRERTAIAYPGASVTFGELRDRAGALARSLLAHEVGAGRRVGVFLPNCLEYIDLLFASALVGAQLVPINARFKRRELAHVIERSEISILFTTSEAADHVDFPGLVLAALPGLGDAGPGEPLALDVAPHLRRVVVIGEAGRPPLTPFAELLATGEDVAPAAVGDAARRVRPDDVATVLYTSGTAAAPKGCMLSHRALISAWWAYAEAIGLGRETPLWSPCPMFHVGGIGPLTSAMAVGATFVSAPHFDADDALEQIIAEEAVHLFPAFPAFTLGVVRAPAYRPERLEHVRTVLNVAPPDTEELIQSMLPPTAVLLNDFGMTEAAGMVTFTPVDDSPHDRLRTNGVPFPGLEIRIADDDGVTEVPPGKAGEIQFRGPNAMSGYLNDPGATAATIIDGGWVRTGDRGRIDDGGHLVYVGRIKEMLKVGGENVAPAEVEMLLSTHPAVAMAQVVGKPDPKYGEVPVAFVELLPGRSATEEELVDHCRGQIANFKLPREVRFVTEWPMSATKIQKFRLRELLLDPDETESVAT